MKPLVLFFLLFYSASCTSTRQASDLTIPELLYQHPLPAFPKQAARQYFRIDLEILVADNGAVGGVRLLNGSGDPKWDSAATEAVKQWKYSPARLEEKPVSIWLHQKAVVQFSEPRYIMLAEILCSTQAESDSAYALLVRGEDFGKIVKRYSIAQSREQYGNVGSVNIQIYPEQIKHALTELDTEQFTKPAKYGNQYVIFKRLKE